MESCENITTFINVLKCFILAREEATTQPQQEFYFLSATVTLKIPTSLKTVIVKNVTSNNWINSIEFLHINVTENQTQREIGGENLQPVKTPCNTKVDSIKQEYNLSPCYIPHETCVFAKPSGPCDRPTESFAQGQSTISKIQTGVCLLGVSGNDNRGCYSSKEKNRMTEESVYIDVADDHGQYAECDNLTMNDDDDEDNDDVKPCFENMDVQNADQDISDSDLSSKSLKSSHPDDDDDADYVSSSSIPDSKCELTKKTVAATIVLPVCNQENCQAKRPKRSVKETVLRRSFRKKKEFNQSFDKTRHSKCNAAIKDTSSNTTANSKCESLKKKILVNGRAQNKCKSTTKRNIRQQTKLQATKSSKKKELEQSLSDIKEITDNETVKNNNVSVEPSVVPNGKTMSDMQNPRGRKKSNNQPKIRKWDNQSEIRKCYPCSHCFKLFPTMKQLEKHTLMHSSNKPITCNFCPKKLKSELTLKRHLKLHSGIKSFTCDVCSKSFFNKSELGYHTRRHTGEKPYMCHICGKSFSWRRTLQRHILQVHTRVKPFKCDFCPKTFIFNNELVKHTCMKQHDKSEYKFQCNICGKKMLQKGNLENHLLSHSNVRAFDCHLCELKFKSKKNLQKHVKTHSNIKDYKCSQCQKLFSTGCNLSRHMRSSHSGDRPFACLVCHKSFAENYLLKQHSQLHMADKQHKCQFCGKEFTFKSSLHSHVKTHKKSANEKKQVCVSVNSCEGLQAFVKLDDENIL